MHTYCLVNGKMARTVDPVLKVNDLGLMRGYGVFDFFPVKSSIPVFFQEYWNRFRNSATIMRLPFDFEQESVSKALNELFDLNKLSDGYCRLLLTGGYSSNGFLPDGPPNFIVTTQGPIHYPESFYHEGIKLITLEYSREYPQIKSINYMSVLLERDRLMEEGAIDVLYHTAGIVTESSRSNFFIINEEGILVTPPPYQVLSGITRGKILELASAFMDIEVRELSLDEVLNAHSAFITSTTKGIIPVTRIDDSFINGGEVKPLVDKIRQALSEMANQYVRNHKSKVSP